MGVTTEKKAKKKEVSSDTLNPFNDGVSYDAFLENVKGTVTIDSLLDKAKCSNEQKDWIKSELKNHKQNKK